MLSNDPLKRVLYIDLSKRKFWVEERKELFERYIGGTGVAIKLLNEEVPENCDPLGPDNPIILTVGPLTALFPIASKTVAMFKSPHTGNLGESHCGGRSAVAIRMAGYGAIVIRGKSEIPIYLSISEGGVRFRDASTLWGMGSTFTVGRVIRENERGAGLRTIMRIGRGGENLVSYASVSTETYRHFGRLGLGAVFGSKKLKAVVVSGKRSLPVYDKREYKALYDEIYREAVGSPVMKKYHDLGTPENVLKLNEFGGLPTRNVSDVKFEGAAAISGEAFAKNYLGRRLACAHCPVGCIHIAALREPYEDEAYFYKTSMISYDYEPIYALASMLGGSDAEGFLRLMDTVEVYGIDVMSTGVILAWATEAFKRGLFSEDETRGVRFEWGNYPEYIRAVKLIIEQPNGFYRALARGVDYASSVYGGNDFAMAFGRNEMPGYHTGPGAHVGYLIGARHSHLDNAGYSVDQKVLVNELLAPEELADRLVAEESWRQILSSIVICFFARGIYTPEVVSRALRVSGLEFPPEELKQLGKGILRDKYEFKFREGFSFEDIRIPKRIYETPTRVTGWDDEYVRKALSRAERAIVT